MVDAGLIGDNQAFSLMAYLSLMIDGLSETRMIGILFPEQSP
ncbi:MAG: hypothetical protein VX371_01815 [Verrucomicrobiota bacterium]|nr:hypothetical protein [Verrucomicrobiota bacterium]